MGKGIAHKVWTQIEKSNAGKEKIGRKFAAVGLLAQLVQSIVLTGRGSPVRIRYNPQLFLNGLLAQGFRALSSHGRGHWFKSSTTHSLGFMSLIFMNTGDGVHL